LGDTSLVSSLDNPFTAKWSIPYKKRTVRVERVFSFLTEYSRYTTYDLISIDAETMDWDILQQMNLTALGCKCLIIEYGGDEDLMLQMEYYCWKHGLTKIYKSPENVIFAKI